MDPTILLETTKQTLWVLLPELLILLIAVAMMTAAPFVRQPRRVWSLVSAASLLAALVVLLVGREWTTDPYLAVALNDAFAFDSRLVLVLSGLILLGLAHDQVDDARAPEFFGCLLMILAGAMLVATANELVFLFVGLELVSIPTYLLLYLPRRTPTTQEAAMKYFFLSIFSSGLLLYGLAFLYGTTGISNLKALAYLAGPGHILGVPEPHLGLIAVVFIMAGLGFRVAAVPFHFYAPDVYEGSPTIMAALLAWVPKAVGFLAIVRTLTAVVAHGGHDGMLTEKAMVLAWALAVITMTVGNTVALSQENLKRLLAYSSIAHAGYLMIGVTVSFFNVPGSHGLWFLGTQGILFYLLAYGLMTLGAFGVIILLDSPDRPVTNVEDLAGLSRSHPVIALALALCLFSLAGIPPLAGFWGKFAIFASAFGAATGDQARSFQILAVIGVLNSAAGAYYYLRIVVAMYLRPELPHIAPIRVSRRWPTMASVAVCSGLSLLLGLYPPAIARPSRAASESAAALPEPIDPAAVTVGSRE